MAAAVSKILWFVIGGIHTDWTFSMLEAGGAEIHGPYDSEKAARVAHDRMVYHDRRYKLYIVRTP